METDAKNIVEFENTKAEWLCAVRHKLQLTGISRAFYRAGFSVGPILGLIAGLFVRVSCCYVPTYDNPRWAHIASIAWRFLIFAGLASLGWWIYWRNNATRIGEAFLTARHRDILNRPELFGQQSCEIAEGFVAMRGPHSSSVLGWQRIKDIVSDEDYIFFDLVGGIYWFIPRHAFASPNDSADFLKRACAFHANYHRDD